MDIIAKKYRVLKSLGKGAMGEVYLVLPPKGDPVALKLLRSLDSKANTQAVEQFENEFKVLKRLSHPNIGRIFDYGFDEELQKVFFTLPWLKGTDLFETSKDMSFEKFEELFVQTLRALNYLHQQNLIHCDLKPGNIYVENGQVLLIDFGLAGYWGENIVGTPTYLAPEIFRGAHHNVASDLYAAGVIAYNCLTRSQPFSGQNLQEVYDRHRKFTPPPISDLNPKVPKYFSDIISTLINKKPEERYPSAASVIEEIDAYSNKTYSVETQETLLSYLPTESEMVGRQEAIDDARIALNDYKSDQIKELYHIITIHGQKNVGKSRLIAKIKNDLQLSKISVENITPPLTEDDQNIILNSKALIFENLDSYFLTADELMNFRKVINLIEQKILSQATNKFILIVSSTNASNFNNLTKLFPPEDTKITSIELHPYSQKETEEFLIKIIGQKEIPKKFAEQFHRNTEGLPGISVQLIQSMIESGHLFDESGRWNEDLLTELDKSFDSLVVSETLEQDFEKIYDSLTGDEEDIINWLCLCPHPLTFSQLSKLSKHHELDKVLNTLMQKKIIREEDQHYSISRSVFQNFIQNNLPNSDAAKRHTKLANPNIGLEKKWSIYHLSLSDNKDLRLKATRKLCQIYEKVGDREKALESYKLLIDEFKNRPIPQRLDWYIEASSLMIWLDRFKEAIELISEIEKQIHKDKPKLDHEKFMILLEKKGLAHLHLEQLEKAYAYFENGFRYSKKYPECKVQQLRFENNLAEIEFMKGHQDKAIKIFKKTRELSKNLSNIDLQNITNNDLGHVYLNLQKFDESLPYLKDDIRIFSHLQNKDPLARAIYSYAEVMRAKNIFEKAKIAYEECIKICKKGHNYPLLLRSYNGLGNLHLTHEENEKALTNYQKALDLSVRLKDHTSKAALLFNQGYIYRKNKNTAMASRRYLMAKQVLENKESKLLAYEELLLSRCYNELAVLAVDEKNAMKALTYQLERLKLVEDSVSLRAEKFNVKLDLAELYLENRLKDQFLYEIRNLETIANDAEEIEKVKNLKNRWEEVEEYLNQETTGQLSVMK